MKQFKEFRDHLQKSYFNDEDVEELKSISELQTIEDVWAYCKANGKEISGGTGAFSHVYFKEGGKYVVKIANKSGILPLDILQNRPQKDGSYYFYKKIFNENLSANNIHLPKIVFLKEFFENKNNKTVYKGYVCIMEHLEIHYNMEIFLNYFSEMFQKKIKNDGNLPLSDEALISLFRLNNDQIKQYPPKAQMFIKALQIVYSVITEKQRQYLKHVLDLRMNNYGWRNGEIVILDPLRI